MSSWEHSRGRRSLLRVELARAATSNVGGVYRCRNATQGGEVESYGPDPQQHTTTTPKQSRCEVREEAHSPIRVRGPDEPRTANGPFHFSFFFIGIFFSRPPCSPQSLFFPPPHPSSSSLSYLSFPHPPNENEGPPISLPRPSSLFPPPPSHPSFSFPPPPTRSREGPSSPTTYPLGLPPPNCSARQFLCAEPPRASLQHLLSPSSVRFTERFLLQS